MDHLRCKCGNYWFQPVSSSRKSGVAFELDGVVSSYFGEFACTECGEPRPEPDPELVKQRLARLTARANRGLRVVNS